MFLVTGTMGFLQTFAPLYVTASGLTTEQFGWMSAIATGLALLVQPILGRWSDKLDRRRPFMVGAALLAGLAYWLYRYADGFIAFTLLSAVGVNAFQYLNAAPAVIVARLSQADGGGAGAATTYVRYRVWGSVGYIVVAMGIGWAVQQFLPPDARLTRAGLNVLFEYGPGLYGLIAILSLFVPDARAAATTATIETDGTTSASTATDKLDTDQAARDDRATRNANLNRFLVTVFLYNFALYGSSTFLPIFMRSLKATPLQITTMFAGGVICEIVVMLIAGRYSDRHGRWPALAFALVTMPIRLLLYQAATTPENVMLVQLMHGLNFGIMGTIAPVFVNDLSDDADRGKAQARLSAASGVGLAVGPLVCGSIATRFGMPSMFLAMAVVGALGAAWFLTQVRESHPTERRA